MFTETYRGAIIAYNESTNTWLVQLDKARIADKESLVKAREAVDRFLTKETETKKKFQRCEAWYSRWDESLGVVTVTSLTDDGTGAWIVNGKKERSKVRLSELFLESAENGGKVQEIWRLESEVKAIGERIDVLKESLTPFSLA